MTTALEEYFERKVTLPEEAPQGAFTPAERAFLERYMGADFESALAREGLARPARVEPVGGPLPEPAQPPVAGAVAAPGLDAATSPAAAVETEAAPGEDIEAALRQAKEIKLVGFRVGGQELAVPISQVQEVIRAVPATKLPSAPPHIRGIMNLRGRVVPLVAMDSLLGLSGPEQENRFIIVCRCRDMLLGLMVSAIAAMHQGRGEDVEWGVEARVGVAAGLISGLLKVREALVKILSVDSLFQKVLKS